ncbi:MAG: Gfo/Idh/MocA family oxidoreductase [Candidatus Burarchaeum sp.]|nr:Gfo/Idh/MocA family oxidoreductase [Candidatus Burarchaeum sp.]MDO8339047.1 Gfo/Idh/MocA family oxidoreductase [Candidatus Burarchaeum sp.]
MTIRLALVGYGYWGPNLARNFSRIKGAELRYIVDLDAKKRGRAAEEYPFIKVVASFEEVLPDVDAVIIATPPKTHFALAKLALNAGKHVLIEKPVTTNVEDAKELAKLAQEKKLTLMIDYIFIYGDYVRYLKGLLDKGELGTLHAFQFQRQAIEFLRRDVNVVEDLMTHDVSMLFYLLGEKAAKPRKITAVGKSHFIKGVEDEAIAYLDYGDMTVTLIVSSLSPVKMRKVMILGDKKMAEFDDMKVAGKVEVHEKEIKGPLEAPANYWDFIVQCNPGSTIIPYVKAREPLANMASHFIDCIEKGKKPDTDISFGLLVTDLIERINAQVKGSAPQ